MSEDIVEYLTKQLREAYTTLAWQRGLFCLRCDPDYGIPCIHTESKDQPWCPYCGKDPLFHGPELMDRTFGFSGFTKFSGLRAGDQLWDTDKYKYQFEEVDNGSGTTPASDRGGREPFQR